MFLICFRCRTFACTQGVRENRRQVHFLNVFFCHCPGQGPPSFSNVCLSTCCSPMVVSQLCFAIGVLQLLFCHCCLWNWCCALLFCNCCFSAAALHLSVCNCRFAVVFAIVVLQMQVALTVVTIIRKAQAVTDEKLKKSSQSNRRTAQEVITDDKTQEVLTG